MIGTTNYFGNVNYIYHAQAWVQMINAINTWIASPPSYLNVEVANGGIDAETEWQSATVTETWANTYAAYYKCVSGRTGCSYYVDFGDAGGCPATYTGLDSQCNGGWYYGDVQWMAWGTVPAYPLPEVYYEPPNYYCSCPVNANQWESVSLYSGQYKGSYMFPLGSLTQSAASGYNPATNSPSLGFQQLQAAVNESPHTAFTLPAETDITYAN